MVNDNLDICSYLARIFEKDFQVFAISGKPTATRLLEDIETRASTSTLTFGGRSGIELSEQSKSNLLSNHIPVVLLIANSSDNIVLEDLTVVADDEERLLAHVHRLIQNQHHFPTNFSKNIQLQDVDCNISIKHKEFIQKVTHIVEEHLDNPKFSVQMLAEAISMSYSNFYRRIKTACGKPANEFIRMVRLQKVAQLLIETEYNVSEAAFAAGFSDIKYFRSKFLKLYGMKPSEYRKKYEVLKQEHRLTT
ncbi:helix-turn-helix domain-containing protein [Sphingobacterium sp. lm-10]|uniref:helix-turn-helix domain-containing protein n=1 Tax=Sphingobacterium sp. lm-10 TaxID=2944904 RepID=UPI0020221C98|nr:helix-turn-helix domain-containing protein [Sphingobacterium sp. lm-10]MCL7986709.1 helix-turn-helix domain-containing protein [Sphingobacterium sp. lm-10]